MTVQGESSKQAAEGIQPPATAPNTPKSADKTIEIKLSLPAVDAKSTLRQVQRQFSHIPRKVLIIGGGLGILALGGFSTHHWLAQHMPLANAKVADSKTKTDQKIPSYPTKLPAGKTIQALGGWMRVSPPDRDPVFAYVDKIGNDTINVSQQPLPPGFKTDTATMVDHLATSFNATQKVTIGNDVIYIGSSVQGPQSVIFAKGNLLFLIKSRAHITTNAWVKYISSLQ